MQQLERTRCFDGWHTRFSHRSKVLDCEMNFAVYLPPAAEHGPVPVLYWLSGLTCNEQNFMQKAGALRTASELGLAIVAPDTSPRGESVPDDPEGAWDLGLGAGFYVNATREPWRQHYRMYDYVVDELPALVESELPLQGRRAICGHSMGGHGALVAALRNPRRYVSVSAFSPIANPVGCTWGRKVFSAYLGDDEAAWQAWDSSLLMTRCKPVVPALVDQGDADNFLEEQLRPEALKRAARDNSYPLQLRMQPGYDHSYYFIATFIEEHLRFHWQHLQ